MNIRINLIHDDEIRQPGLFNPKMILRISLVTVVGAIVLGVTVLVLHANSINRSLKQARARLRQVDPTYQDVRGLQQDLSFNRALFKDLQGWNKSRFEWHKELMTLQATVPASIQLTRLAIRSNVTVINPPKWEKKALPVPARQFTLRLDGQAVGELGDEVVVQFVRTLRDTPAMNELIPTVKLATGLHKTPGRSGAEDRWSFVIEAESAPRKME